MPLSKLFENLANHYQSDVRFSEELTYLREIEQNMLLVSYQELLQFDSTIDFITPRAKGKNCTKGWPCGNTCLSSTRAKNCDKPLLGQAKTYAEWLKMQKDKDKQSLSKTVKASGKTTKKSDPTNKPSKQQDAKAKKEEDADDPVQQIQNIFDKNKEVLDQIQEAEKNGTGKFYGEADRLAAAQLPLKEISETGKIKGTKEQQAGIIEDLLQHADRPLVGDSIKDGITQQSMKSAERIYSYLSDEAKDLLAEREYENRSLAEIMDTGAKRNNAKESKAIRQDLVNRIKARIAKGEMVDLYGELE